MLKANETVKAVGYTRCSTQEQADSGLGLDAQTERIRAYCSMRALQLLDIVTDAGVSGGKLLATREGGIRLLEALRSHKAQAVVMLKLDRMFRNAGDCLTTIEKWEKAGVALHVVDLGGNAIDTTSAAGRFMLVVLAGAAEMERNLVRERTRAAMAVKKANGQRVGAGGATPGVFPRRWYQGSLGASASWNGSRSYSQTERSAVPVEDSGQESMIGKH